MKLPGWLRRILVAVKNTIIQKAAEEAAKGMAKSLPKEDDKQQ